MRVQPLWTHTAKQKTKEKKKSFRDQKKDCAAEMLAWPRMKSTGRMDGALTVGTYSEGNLLVV